jgi:hypothetical protein
MHAALDALDEDEARSDAADETDNGVADEPGACETRE